MPPPKGERLTPQQVRRIRNAYEMGTESMADLAHRFNCGASTIARIVHGQRGETTKFRRGESHPMAKLSALDVVRIRDMIDAGFRPTDVARMYLISTANLYRITRGLNWATPEQEKEQPCRTK